VRDFQPSLAFQIAKLESACQRVASLEIVLRDARCQMEPEIGVLVAFKSARDRHCAVFVLGKSTNRRGDAPSACSEFSDCAVPFPPPEKYSRASVLICRKIRLYQVNVMKQMQL